MEFGDVYQSQRERLASYEHRIRRAAFPCGAGPRKRKLLEYFVRGLRDQLVKARVLQKKDKALADALHKAEFAARRTRTVSLPHSDATSNDTIVTGASTTAQLASPSTVSAVNLTTTHRIADSRTSSMPSTGRAC